MPRLAQAVRRLRGDRGDRSDRGGVSVIVAVLLAGGVLLGMTAIVVDLGQIYAEREELQSGADAAAMAIALDCAKGRADCTAAGVRTTAEELATANARDGFANALEVCGEDGTGGPLAPCPPDTANNLTDCLDLRSPGTANYVEVHTTTQTAGGTLLPPTFAAAAVPGYDGTTVGACAQVAWGVPRSGLAFTLSACEWSQATGDGTDYAPAPPASVTEADERVVVFRNPGGGSSCPSGPSGWDRPGGFGWVEEDDGDCVADFTGPSYEPKTGNGIPAGCRDAVAAARGRVVVVPVYDSAVGVGANTRYHLYGMAAFVVTGYRLSRLTARSSITNRLPCGPGQACISGYFVDTIVDWSGSVTGGLPHVGAVAVRTTG